MDMHSSLEASQSDNPATQPEEQKGQKQKQPMWPAIASLFGFALMVLMIVIVLMFVHRSQEPVPFNGPPGDYEQVEESPRAQLDNVEVQSDGGKA